MAWNVTADPERFPEAVEYFRSKLPLTDDEFDRLSKEAQDGAFHVAGAQQLDVVQDLFDEIEKAIAGGEGYDSFAKRVQEKLPAHWNKSTSHLLETTFRTNVQTALNTGRYFQLTDPAIAEQRPYWMFDAVLDERTSDICEACDSTVLRADHPWWLTHYPPLHHRCRTSVRAVTASKAKRLGIAEGELPSPKVDDGFGLVPPLRSTWRPDSAKYHPVLWDAYQQKQNAR